MSANLFGNRFYGHRDAAWHTLGTVTQENMKAVDVLNMIGGYSFEKRPVMLMLNGTVQEVGDYAIVRSPVPDDPVERNFGYITDGYHVLQPLDICTIFDENVGQAVETLGMLGNGERLFLTWKLPEFDVKGDEIKVYGTTAVGYDAKFGANLYVLTTRIVCENTWNVAMNEAANTKEYGRGKVWVGKHTSPNIYRDLGIWMEHIQTEAESRALLTQNLFKKFADVPLHPENDKEEVYNMLFGIYPNPKGIPEYFPKKLMEEKQEKINKATESALRDRELVYRLFNGAGTAIDASCWGLFNAVTEYENWGRMSKKSPEVSVLFGARANSMDRASVVINDWIETRS